MKKLSFALAALSLTAPSLASAQPTAQPTPQDGVVIEQVPTEPTAGPPASAPPPKKEKSIPISMRADGGYGMRTVERLAVTGADFGLAIGAQPAKHFAIYGAARGYVGSTDAGLDVRSLRVSADLDIVIDRIRIGFDPGLFFVGVGRATRDTTIFAWGPKIGAALRLDVIRADAFALFLRASADVGPTFQDGSAFGGFMFGAGIDFDLKPGDRESL